MKHQKISVQAVLAFSFGVVFIALMLTIALKVPSPTPTQWFAFRVVLALAAAGIGAIIPGLIVIHASNSIRAGGAIALFVLVYWANPPQLVVETNSGTVINQFPSGPNSPAVVSSGDVRIDTKATDNDNKSSR